MTLSSKLATTRLRPLQPALNDVAVSSTAAVPPHPIFGVSWGTPQIAGAPAVFVAGELITPLEFYNRAYAAAFAQHRRHSLN